MSASFDVVLSELLNMLEPYSSHFVIGGGTALLIYRDYLAQSKTAPRPAATNDIDALIPRNFRVRAAGGTVSSNLAAALKRNGFKVKFKSLDSPPVEAYFKEIKKFPLELEFLTDNRARKAAGANVHISGVSAQPLSYIEMSLREACVFHTSSRAAGLVVLPGAWIFHKALTFVERKNKEKRCKDLYGIWYVASQLDACSEEAIEKFKRLGNERRAWRKKALGHLAHWIEAAGPNDWDMLESQDPSGNLTRARFRSVISMLGSEIR